MKKITLASSAILLAASVLSFTSCKKDDDTKSRSELVVGTWTLNAYGVDDNMDGILQTTEYDVIPAGVSQVQVYRSDKTGMVTTQGTSGPATSFNMKWKFDTNDQNLIVTNDNNGTSTTAVVTQLTENDLMGYDPAPAIRTIYLFKK